MASTNKILTQRVKADLTLLLVSIVWGSAFVAQRVAAQQMSVYYFNGLRFLIGAIIMLPFYLSRRNTPYQSAEKVAPGILLAGILLFAGTSFQQTGMRYTTAANAGFITGLYVVIIPVILTLGLRRSPRPTIWVAACMATLGLFLLSTEGSLRLAPGDGLELAGACMWAFHVILVGWLVKKVHVYPLAVGQYLVCGTLSLAAGFTLEGGTIPGLEGVWWAVIYTGVISIGLGYTLQAVGQKVAPPADAAIILSTEAVFAALFGWVLIEERLSGIQLAGSGLMLAGMLLAQLDPRREGHRTGENKEAMNDE